MEAAAECTARHTAAHTRAQWSKHAALIPRQEPAEQESVQCEPTQPGPKQRSQPLAQRKRVPKPQPQSQPCRRPFSARLRNEGTLEFLGARTVDGTVGDGLERVKGLSFELVLEMCGGPGVTGVWQRVRMLCVWGCGRGARYSLTSSFRLTD